MCNYEHRRPGPLWVSGKGANVLGAGMSCGMWQPPRTPAGNDVSGTTDQPRPGHGVAGAGLLPGRPAALPPLPVP